jgi:adenylate cyclase
MEKSDAKKTAGKKRARKKLSPARLIIAALLTAGVLTGVLHSGLMSAPNLYIADRLYQRERMPEAPVFILGIDEAAIENLGPYHTWPRDYIAEVIELLNEDPDWRPAAIGVDVLYVGHTDPEADGRLAEACAAGNVIMAARTQVAPRMIFEDDGREWYNRHAVIMLETPYPELAGAVAVGLIDPVDESFYGANDYGVVRRAYQYRDFPADIAEAAGTDARLPSFALAVYKQYVRALGEMGINGLELPEEPRVPDNIWQIPYTARPGGFSDGFSVWDIISGEIPADIFADCIVLIGPYTIGMRDSYMTPIDASQPMHGVEIHANIIDAMVRGEYRIDMPPVAAAAVTFIMLAVLFAAFYFLNPMIAALILAAVAGGWVFLAAQLVHPAVESWFLFDNARLQLPVVYLPGGAVILYFGTVIAHFFAARREKRQVTDTFKKYVDPAIIADLMETGLDNLELGGRMTDICVMFIDIRGFTPMSEIMTPPEVVALLNDYLKVTSDAIFKHNGTLDKFIGDATMAFWGAPLPQDDIAYKAVLAAWDMVQSGMRLEAELMAKYGRTVGFGIGLNMGEAVVGNIGTARRLDYTAIGNTVNTSARLESNARPGQILMSESVYKAVEGRISAQCVGNIPLKGKSEELTVYALEHIKEYEGQYEPLESAKSAPGK